MLKIKFEYRDKYTNGNWNEQECIMSSVKECKEFYGLGIDCEYRIVKVEEVKQNSSINPEVSNMSEEELELWLLYIAYQDTSDNQNLANNPET